MPLTIGSPSSGTSVQLCLPGNPGSPHTRRCSGTGSTNWRAASARDCASSYSCIQRFAARLGAFISSGTSSMSSGTQATPCSRPAIRSPTGGGAAILPMTPAIPSRSSSGRAAATDDHPLPRFRASNCVALWHDDAAVGVELLARVDRSSLTGEEDNGESDVFGDTEASDRDLALHARVIQRRAPEQLRVGGARYDNVDVHGGCKGESQRPCEREHASLRRCVVRQ